MLKMTVSRFTQFAGIRAALRIGLPIFAIIPLSACNSGPSALDAASQCTDPRPQVCTMLYAPVCATHQDSHLETHSSSCNACADDSVVSYRNGVCEETQSK
ncbi:MAG: hypothetical protein AAF098_08010 [Pseudomonadota bacterium]